MNVALKEATVIQHGLDRTFHRVVDDGVPCSGLNLPESRNSPEAAKAILMPSGRNPAPAKRAAFRAFYL